MSVEGYQCQTCWATFTPESTCDPHEKTELKCPTCQSTNLKKVDLPENWLGRARGSFHFG